METILQFEVPSSHVTLVGVKFTIKANQCVDVSMLHVVLTMTQLPDH